MITLSASLADVNAQNMVFEDRHTADDEAVYLKIRQAEHDRWVRRAEKVIRDSLELLAEEARWQASLSGLEGLTHEERAQSLGLRLVVA